MTCEEFSNEFDTLLQGYNLKYLFGELNPLLFDEYEKSLFLTKALENFILSQYSGKNHYSESFEKTEENRRYLSALVKTEELLPLTLNLPIGVSTQSKFFSLPENTTTHLNDVWFITYESIIISNTEECLNGKNIIVLPVTLDDYYRISKNPFRQSNERKALRLDISNNIVEIVTPYTITKYIIRYLSKPKPIILVNLSSGLAIEGETNQSSCLLHSATHRMILEEAVRIAVTSKIGKENNK